MKAENIHCTLISVDSETGVMTTISEACFKDGDVRIMDWSRNAKEKMIRLHRENPKMDYYTHERITDENGKLINHGIVTQYLHDGYYKIVAVCL